jgi:hypothetical protein
MNVNKFTSKGVRSALRGGTGRVSEANRELAGVYRSVEDDRGSPVQLYDEEGVAVFTAARGDGDDNAGAFSAQGLAMQGRLLRPGERVLSVQRGPARRGDGSGKLLSGGGAEGSSSKFSGLDAEAVLAEAKSQLLSHSVATIKADAVDESQRVKDWQRTHKHSRRSTAATGAAQWAAGRAQRLVEMQAAGASSADLAARHHTALASPRGGSRGSMGTASRAATPCNAATPDDAGRAACSRPSTRSSFAPSSRCPSRGSTKPASRTQ